MSGYLHSCYPVSPKSTTGRGSKKKREHPDLILSTATGQETNFRLFSSSALEGDETLMGGGCVSPVGEARLKHMSICNTSEWTERRIKKRATTIKIAQFSFLSFLLFIKVAIYIFFFCSFHHFSVGLPVIPCCF